MRARSISLVAVAAALLAGKGKEPPPAPEPPPVPVEAPRPPAPPPVPLWPKGLPVSPGALPPGLANLSAQGCAACHAEVHEDWSASGHRATPDAFREATAHETPACTLCHLAIDVQRDAATTFTPGDPNRWTDVPNPSFDATLAQEGVTCATCHVRDGVVLGTREVAAPHPVRISPDLGSNAACAPCHQLDWPGSARPFYDTMGEWSRSDWATAGVDCADCHLRDGHAGTADADRAVSVLVRVDAKIVRGGPPLPVSIVVQNTGAGHAFPTGSPFRGVRLEATLRGPSGKKGDIRAWGKPLVADLAQEVGASAPWTLGADHRIQAGGSRTWEWTASLPVDAPAGTWTVDVTLTRTRYGKPVEAPFLVQRYPLRVQ